MVTSTPHQERGSPPLEVQDMNGAERQTHMTLPDLSFPPEKQLQGVPPIPSAQRPRTQVKGRSWGSRQPF